MTEAMHPRLRARVLQAERQRSLAAEARHMADIGAVEQVAREMEGVIGASLAASVLETCMVLRRSLNSHDPDTAAGSIIRRFLPTRLLELRLVCTDTAMMLSDRVFVDA